MFHSLTDVLLLFSVVLNVFLLWLLGRKAGTQTDATAAPVARPTSERDLASVRDVLRAEGKIQAIKRYRELTGTGLLDAKNAVEALERS